MNAVGSGWYMPERGTKSNWEERSEQSTRATQRAFFSSRQNPISFFSGPDACVRARRQGRCRLGLRKLPVCFRVCVCDNDNVRVEASSGAWKAGRKPSGCGDRKRLAIDLVDGFAGWRAVDSEGGAEAIKGPKSQANRLGRYW